MSPSILKIITSDLQNNYSLWLNQHKKDSTKTDFFIHGKSWISELLNQSIIPYSPNR